jgi:DNA-binding winged helix-turn-helix (wHTH) protein/tetratricopeptide (TPR) repeat protein
MKPPRSDDPPALRIDADSETAWCGGRRLHLAPKTFALLVHLVAHPHRLITKDDLLATVWRDAIVSDAALTSAIRDLRRALRDSSRGPRYIETVHRRGFRFIGSIARPDAPPSGTGRRAEPGSPMGVAAPTALVGRDAELARLRERWGRALAGQRQLVFVTGEPGIGKTTLVEAFVADVGDGVRVGRGQCVDQYGAGEPYLPVLEALGRLGRGADGERLVRVLAQQAPTWLAQLPSLATDRDLEMAERRTQGATRERMLRELVEALDTVTAEAPLVLLLEDLHWSDTATIDLLAMLARRREPSRLFVLGTYRPADVGAAHALTRAKHELEMHGQCDEVPVAFLGVAAVDELLARRFPGHRFPSELAGILHRNTEGSPLFLVTMIDFLVDRGQLREIDGQWECVGSIHSITLGTPRTLTGMVEQQIERLSDRDRALLEAGSVAGAEFSAAIATARGIDARAAEQRCEALARRGQLLRAAGVAEWPDGTIAARYAFIHALYQQALYARIAVGERVALHLRTAARLEEGYGGRADEIAAELAMHFERGMDLERAARYLRAAGAQAVRLGALDESIRLYERALEHVRRLPESLENRQRAIDVRLDLHAPLFQLGQASRLVELHREAADLARDLGDQPRLGRVLYRIGSYAWMDARYAEGIDSSRQALDIATALGDRALLTAAAHVLGVNFEALGDYPAAIAELVRIVDGPDAEIAKQRRDVTIPTYVAACAWLAVCLAEIGELDRAEDYGDRGVREAEAVGHALGEAIACTFRATPLLARGDFARALPWCERAVRITDDKGLLGPLPVVYSALGYARVLSGRADGLDDLERAATMHAKSAIRTRLPELYTRWADGLLIANRLDEARETVETALRIAESSGERGHHAEALYVAGRIAAANGARAAHEAAQLFQRAQAIGTELGMRPLVARCHLERGRLAQRIGKGADAEAHLTTAGELFDAMGMPSRAQQAARLMSPARDARS